MTEFDLEAIIANIKPNIVTPKLGELVDVQNPKKPKTIANIIVRHMHSTLDNPVTKDVLHNGEVHKIRYFDIEPLMTGVWAEVSLMILHLSYGEQVSIIESIYPPQAQLTAKAFAINFTPDVKTTNVKIENDTEIVDKLDSANAGIATIIAILKRLGSKSSGGVSAGLHPDNIKRELDHIKSLVVDQRSIAEYKQQMSSADSAAKHQDGLRK